jgi:hypothetical protein
MDNQFLDHGNIASLRTLFRTFPREALTTMKQLKLAEQEIPRFPPFSTLSIFVAVELLDMHRCALADFPGVLIVKSLPALVSVDLSDNQLTEVTPVLPLGQLRRLKELRLEGNPMPYINLRVVVLRKLLYPERQVHLKMVRIYTGIYRQSSLPELPPLAFGNTKLQPRQALLLNRKRKPAPVPRLGSFPMLEILCGGLIMADELESARPYPEADIYSSPQHPKPSVPSFHSPLVGRLLPKKSLHPCLTRAPRVEPTPRWLKVESVVLNGTTAAWKSLQTDNSQHPERSYETSFIREDDSQARDSSGEEDEVGSPRKQSFFKSQTLPDAFTPRSDSLLSRQVSVAGRYTMKLSSSRV